MAVTCRSYAVEQAHQQRGLRPMRCLVAALRTGEGSANAIGDHRETRKNAPKQDDEQKTINPTVVETETNDATTTTGAQTIGKIVVPVGAWRSMASTGASEKRTGANIRSAIGPPATRSKIRQR